MGWIEMPSYLRTIEGQEHYVGEVPPPIECFRCGLCCTRYQPQLTHGEAAAIAQGLGVTTEGFLAKYAQLTNVGYLLRQSAQGCVFLSWEEDGNRANCSIYPFRPEACRNWIASLFRSECREGLTRLKAEGSIMQVKEVYPSPATIDRFSRHLSIKAKKGFCCQQ